MSSTFKQQYEKEFLKSELLRVKISLGIFIFGTVASLINYFFVATNTTDEFGKDTVLAIFLLMISLSSFELLNLLFVGHQIRNNHRIGGQWVRYFNAFAEVTSVCVAIYLITGALNNPMGIFNLPIAQILYLFIVLSTLRLDFRLSAFIGVITAVEVFMLSWYIQQVGDKQVAQSDFIVCLARAMPYLITGIASAVVAAQIRHTVFRTIKETEKNNQVVSLFGQQISKEIVDEMLIHNGRLESRKSRVSIMFIDIRNFTSYVIGKSPAEIVAYQNAFFSIVIESVTRHKGVVNQFLGDGCMVTFGAPVSLLNASRHAVDAALEIRETISKRVAEGLIPATRVGIGIHTGDVVTGNIGTDQRQQYSVTGSAVILAARLEQLNKDLESEILISAEVMDEISGLPVRPQPMGPVSIKGWEEPVFVHRLA